MGLKIKAGSSLKAGVSKKSAARRAKLAVATAAAGTPVNQASNDLVKSLAVVERKIAELKPAPRRVRRSSTTQLGYLLTSIKQDGFVGVILIAGDEIVDGHQRVEALTQLGCETVPAMDVSHLKPAQIKRLSVALNRIGETGEWDLDNLRLTLIEIEFDGFEIGDIGFTPDGLDTVLLNGLEDGIGQLDSVPKLKAGPPTAKIGDLWQLGPHRLICGSALDADCLDALLQGETVTTVFTDPPYNVKIKGNVSSTGKHDEFVMASGEQTPEEFAAFLTSFLTRCATHLVDRGVIYAFMDWRGFSTLHRAGETAGLTLINAIVWDKGNGGMGAFYRSAHEFAAVFCKGSSPLINNVKLGAKGRDRTNVWKYPGANQLGSSANKALSAHPTPKNVEMVVDALLDASNKGDAVLDPFCGSGTTIIAAEECGRVAYAVELDPKYIDRIIERWEALVGVEAVLIETGETFAQAAQRRACETMS